MGTAYRDIWATVGWLSLQAVLVPVLTEFTSFFKFDTGGVAHPEPVLVD